jgi:DNA replication factor GINS
MYAELCAVWKKELENIELEKLPPDFYSTVADYVRRLSEESRMLDKRTVKATLLRKEMRNVRYMAKGLIETRYRKIVRKLSAGEEIPHDVLTPEEEKIHLKVSPLAETMENFAKEILRGRLADIGVQHQRKRAVLRFLKDVPAIIGADMKTYGPFEVEDVSSVPTENAKIFVKQGLAEKVEANRV